MKKPSLLVLGALVVGAFASAIVFSDAPSSKAQALPKNIKALTKSTCPQNPTAIFAGTTNIPEGPEWATSPANSLNITSGTLGAVRDSVGKGCRVSVLLSSGNTASAYNDLHQCNSVETTGNSFKCYIGPTHQFLTRSLREDLLDATTFNDTSIEISQMEEDAYVLDFRGRVANEPAAYVFLPNAYIGRSARAVPSLKILVSQ